jgi:tetratricopeptide (TPR) repeat protein
MAENIASVRQPPFPRRKEMMRLWQLFVAAAVVHAVIVLAFSPKLFVGGEEDSPEALLAKARKLVEEQKYEEAMETYQRVIALKPQTPLVFVDAEKEIRDVRLKALAQQKKAAEAAKAAEGAKPQEGHKPPAGTEGGKPAEVKPPEGEKPLPPVELPTLPGIDG